ncbi:MAG: hypothetical protein IJO83_05195 [Clostridia bacterium]|nr:hypothetical protein [Clostridia bacterium]
MVDKLTGAVAEGIRDAFGEKAEVYTERVHQNAVKPCFFVECESMERIEMLNRNFFVRAHVAVIYENEGDEKRNEAEGITANLFKLLSLVKAGDVTLNGRRIHGKWENGALIVRVCYDIWQKEGKEECGVMEKIEVKGVYGG